MVTSTVFETRIEAGCTRVRGMENSWVYRYTDLLGHHVLVFTAEEGEVPEIGDTIRGGKLRKLEGLLVNDDTSRWQRKFKEDSTW